jgi:hypothetical protein
MAGNNFKDDPQKASAAGKKGGQHSHAGQQDQSHSGRGQQGGSGSSGQRGGSHEQQSAAGKPSHKHR